MSGMRGNCGLQHIHEETHKASARGSEAKGKKRCYYGNDYVHAKGRKIRFNFHIGTSNSGKL